MYFLLIDPSLRLSVELLDTEFRLQKPLAQEGALHSPHVLQSNSSEDQHE